MYVLRTDTSYPDGLIYIQIERCTLSEVTIYLTLIHRRPENFSFSRLLGLDFSGCKMSASGRHGKPDEELFLNRPMSPDSPTVEPLRISKIEPKQSPEQKQRRPSLSQQNSFPLPPSASSSHATAPLPYPDDRDRPRPQKRATERSGQQTASERIIGFEPGRQSPAFTSQSPQAGPTNQGRSNIPEYPSALRTKDPKEGRDGQPSQPSSRLAERRGNIPKPLPDSPGPETPDKEGLFQRLPQRHAASTTVSGESQRPAPAEANPYPEYYQQYWPPPGGSSSGPPAGLAVQSPGVMNRLSSTASTSTTRAQRGSPPPPETPIVAPGEQPGGGIEARYAAAGIAGTSTLTSLQAQNAAAAQRANQYGPQSGRVPQQLDPPRRPWTPTEPPGSQPHGPPTVYQGPSQATTSPPIHAPAAQSRVTSPQVQPGRNSIAPTAIEQDFQRMHVTASPPPAYSPSGSTTATTQGYPSEKPGHGIQPGPAGGFGAAVAPGANSGTAAGPVPSVSMPAEASHHGHPAFANEPRQQIAFSPQASLSSSQGPSQQFAKTSPAPIAAGPASPPPLPEGWIAHLDPNSGQYYYIHLPTQSTQWEFPKGPTPLNLNEPLSPTLSVYGNNPLASPGLSAFGGKPLASPGFQPSTPGFNESHFSMQSSTPTVAGFTGPPPSAGVDQYKIAPTNGVYFGPYLRYINMDLHNRKWLGSILLVTDAPQPPAIHIHQSIDLSPNPRQLKAIPISVHQRWTFYRYDIDLQMEEIPSKWTYAITSHLGCTRYEFLVAGQSEINWRFIAISGNDFSLNVNANERARVGGIGYMWKDIMQKHVECGGFHAQLGLGNQIYADRIWKEIPLLRQWLATSGKENRKNAPWTAKHEEDVSHAYFHYYTSHFDQPYLREAFAQIPHVLQIDDHDM